MAGGRGGRRRQQRSPSGGTPASEAGTGSALPASTGADVKVEAGSGSPDRKPGSACQSPAGGVSAVGPGGVSPARSAPPAGGRAAGVFLHMPVPLRIKDRSPIPI